MSKLVADIIKQRHDQTVFKALGLEITKLDSDETIVGLTIDERHHQHMGLVHGGIYVLLAESAASIAAACTLTDDNLNVVAIEINANHLRSTKEGRISARSKLINKGKNILLYEVRVEDQKARLVSMARCTLMIVERRLF
jgi:uncharacterized protein (TIGR00369 family)